MKNAHTKFENHPSIETEVPREKQEIADYFDVVGLIHFKDQSIASQSNVRKKINSYIKWNGINQFIY